MAILLALLADTEPGVIASAVWALGHRRDARAVEPMIGLVAHPDSEVRYAIASSLSGAASESSFASQAAVTLTILCRDEDFDTRNWAMFGLGQMAEQDSPAIREALFHGLADSDPEIHGEALVGLAMRKVPGTAELIRRDLAGDEIFLLPLEAALELEDVSLLPDLLGLRGAYDWTDNPGLRDTLDSVVTRLQAVNESGGI